MYVSKQIDFVYIMAKRRIRDWCNKNNVEIERIGYVYPTAYIVGRTTGAKASLSVTIPWLFAPDHLKQKYRNSGAKITVRTFDKTLDVNHWCFLAYVVTKFSNEFIAVAFENIPEDEIIVDQIIAALNAQCKSINKS